jgi:hypothetical protein
MNQLVDTTRLIEAFDKQGMRSGDTLQKIFDDIAKQIEGGARLAVVGDNRDSLGGNCIDVGEYRIYGLGGEAAMFTIRVMEPVTTERISTRNL